MRNLLLCCLVIVIAACGVKAVKDNDPVAIDEVDSGETVPIVVEEDASVTPVVEVDSSVPVDAATDSPVVKSCLDTCLAKHPEGVKLGEAIDACWDTNCKNPCLLAGVPSGNVVGPDLVVTDGGTCTTQVLTPFVDCSNCTVAFCCEPWDKTFTNADALALNECTNACWGK